MTAASIAGMAVASGLAIAAIDARDDAREQRRQAEGLVGFMIGDLKDRLEPLGRLEALDAVGARALAYYEQQDKESLSDEALSGRSRALTMMGEIANARGDLDSALARYREALQGTAEAIRRRPDAPDRLFDHAQNVFWVGYIAWQRGDAAQAEARFRDYKSLANRMIALDPDERKWQLEGIYADTNLGVLLLEEHRYRDAAAAFAASLRLVEALASANPRDIDTQIQLSDSLAYHADALEYGGRLEPARAQRERQLALIDKIRALDPAEMIAVRQRVAAERALGRLHMASGRVQPAMDHARRATVLAEQLFRTEPENTEWMQAGATAWLDLADAALSAGDVDEARSAAERGCDVAGRLAGRDPTVVRWRSSLRASCQLMRARIALRRGFGGETVELAHAAGNAARLNSRPTERAFAIASANIVSGSAFRLLGDQRQARTNWARALAGWPKSVELTPPQQAELAMLNDRLGRTAEAAQISAALDRIGYREPEYIGYRKRGGGAQ